MPWPGSLTSALGKFLICAAGPVPLLADVPFEPLLSAPRLIDVVEALNLGVEQAGNLPHARVQHLVTAGRGVEGVNQARDFGKAGEARRAASPLVMGWLVASNSATRPPRTRAKFAQRDLRYCLGCSSGVTSRHSCFVHPRMLRETAPFGL